MPHDEEHIAALLRSLPPAPPGWVAAASELPIARRALAEIETWLADHPEHAAQTAALEAALEQAGFEPTPGLLDAVRRELGRAAPPAD
jgi:ferric-dicitrate binding protein FerR (iron transport regulator)